MKHRGWMVGIALIAALAAGVGAGYLIWGWPTNWYARDVTNLPASPENDIIRYGHSLIVETPKQIGKSASDPQKRYAGNDLACKNCHLDAGLRPFAAPFVSTFATFPMLVDDQVITFKERINGCMRRSMNGKNLPEDGPEMEALIAYIKFLGHGTPEGVRVAGMGLLPLADPPLAAEVERSTPISAPTATRMRGRGSATNRRNLAIRSRRFGATTASMRLRAWPSSHTPRPMSAPTCPSACSISIRCSPSSRRGMSRPT